MRSLSRGDYLIIDELSGRQIFTRDAQSVAENPDREPQSSDAPAAWCDAAPGELSGGGIPCDFHQGCEISTLKQKGTSWTTS
jgi:hypothetical protein